MPNHPESTLDAPSDPRALDVLLFRAQGMSLAVSASHTEGVVTHAEAVRRGIGCGTLDGCAPPAMDIACASPMVLLLRDGQDLFGVGIDGLDSIQSVSLDSLRLLPEALTRFEGPRRFWAILIQPDGLVLLVNPARLKNTMRSANSTPIANTVG